MIELGRHIHSLLLDNDCVAVPGLGGFVTHYMPARKVDEDTLFLPPYRTVAFNAALSFNDGVLVNSYMDVYDLSYPDALRKITFEVAALKDKIQQDGACYLDNLGRLELKYNGQYRFTPIEAGVLTPDLYGLGTLNLKSRVFHRHFEGDVVASAVVAQKRQYRLLNAFAYYGVAALLALVVYFAVSAPVDFVASNTQRAALSVGMVEVKGHAHTDKPNQAEVAHKIVESPVAMPIQSSLKEQEKTYSIVLASAVTGKRAARYVEELKGKGYGDAFVYNKGKMTQVLLGRYGAKEEAEKALRALHKVNGMEEAWVIKLEPRS